MIKVGIINPGWSLNRHNTDHRCVVDFAEIGKFSPDLCTSFASSFINSVHANLNLLSTRILGRRLSEYITVNTTNLEFNVLYDYGGRPWGLRTDRNCTIPILTTVGFPVLRQTRDKGQEYFKEEAKNVIKLTQGASLIHFHTECMRDSFVAYAPKWAEKTEVIPFFLPHLQCISDQALDRKFSADSFRLLFVGADGARKGIDDVSTALDLIAETLHRQRVSMTFVSRRKPTCTKYKNITYHTALERDAIQSLMRNSHLYLMVPHTETFGLVYVEAMAAGCGVIADDDLPRQEILNRGECGRMVSPGNPQKIADAILDFIEDRTSLFKSASLGRRRVLDHYSPRRVAMQYAHAFERAASK